jgi:hypothetical protein
MTPFGDAHKLPILVGNKRARKGRTKKKTGGVVEGRQRNAAIMTQAPRSKNVGWSLHITYHAYTTTELSRNGGKFW